MNNISCRIHDIANSRLQMNVKALKSKLWEFPLNVNEFTTIWNTGMFRVGLNRQIYTKPEILQMLEESKNTPPTGFVDVVKRQEEIDNLINDLKSSMTKTPQKPKFNTNNLAIYGLNTKEEKDSFLSVNTSNPTAYIPVFESSINQMLHQEMVRKLITLTFFDPETNTIVLNQENLNNNFLNYKNQLLEQIVRYISKKTGTTINPIFLSKTNTQEEIDFYNQIMEQAYQLILNEWNGQAIQSPLNENNRNNIINPIAAFYTLLNFDKIVEGLSYGDIKVKESYKDTLEYYVEKYATANKKDLAGSWEDRYDDIDGEKRQATRLRNFISLATLPGGESLSAKFLTRLILTIKNFAENRREEDENGQKVIIIEQIRKLLDPTLSLEERLEQLGLLLTPSFETSFTRRAGAMECKALWELLYSFQNAAKSAMQNMSIKEKNEFMQHNPLYMLFSEFNKSQMTYAQVNDDQTIEMTSVMERARTKAGVRGILQQAVVRTIENGLLHLLSDGFIFNMNTSATNLSDLLSARAQKTIQILTGYSLEVPEIYEIFSQPGALTSLANYLTALRMEILKEFPERSTIYSQNAIINGVKRAFDRLASTEGYVNFTGRLIANNVANTEKIKDQSGNQLAASGVNTTISSFRKNLQEFTQFYPESANILLTNPSLTTQTQSVFNADEADRQKSSFISHIVYASDTAVKKGKHYQYLRPTDLSVKQLASVGLWSDYAASIALNNVILLQLEAYADKVRIAKGCYNLYNSKDKFQRQSLENIKTLGYKQWGSYYQHIAQNIVEFWNPVLPKLENKSNTLEDVLTYLEKLPTFESEQAAEDYMANFVTEHNPHTNIFRDVHYSIIQVKNGYKISLNATLLRNIRMANNKDFYKSEIDYGFSKFLQHCQETGIPINFDDAQIEKLSNSPDFLALFTTNEMLYGLDGAPSIDAKLQYNVKKLLKELGDGTGLLKDIILKLQSKTPLSTAGQLLYNFLYRYHWTTHLLREADLEVSLKSPWIHDSASSNLSAGELQTFLSTKDQEELKEILDRIRQEETKRINKGKKRNNSGTAAYEPWLTGYNYSLPDELKIAHIEHAQQWVTTFFGDSTTLNSHDGAMFSTALTRHWERNSAPGKHVAEVLKVIALCPTQTGFMQIKCADYTLTNAIIRNSLKTGTEQFNGDTLMQKMLSPAALTTTFFKAWQANSTSLGHSVYYEFRGKIARLTKVDINNDNQIKFEWTYLDGTAVDQSEIQNCLFNEIGLTSTDGYYEITNAYQLWKALGGAHSKELNDDYEYEYTDVSQILLADLMSEFDPSLKSAMVHKLVDEEASKSSQGIKNSKNRIFNSDSPLVCNYLRADRYGIQQDYSHEGEESEIPMLTQVVTAIAFNGENSEMVQNLYEVLGQIIENSLSPLLKKWNTPGHREFHKFLAQEMLRNLENNTIKSNAESLVKDLLEKIKQYEKDNNVQITLPYSNNQLFYLATSNLLVALNHKSLKQTFAGVSVVQNPANGIIGLYEDKYGVKYQESDLLKLANQKFQELLNKDESELTVEELEAKTTVYTQDQIRDWFIKNDERFKGDELITSGKQITVGDVIEITPGVRISISSPQELIRIYQEYIQKGIPIKKVYGVKRDLKTSLYTWDGDDKGNFWLLESTQANIQDKEDPLIQLWQTYNRRALKQSNAFYFKDKDLFYLWFRQGADFNRADLENFNIQRVTNVQYIGGEEILPKQWKTKLGLKGSMSEIKSQKEKYFEPLVRERFNYDSSIILGDRDFVVTLNDYDIVFTDQPVISEYYTSVNQHKDGTYGIIDDYGNELEDITLPSSLFKGQQIEDIKLGIREGAKNKKIITITYNSQEKDLNKIIKWLTSSIRHKNEIFDKNKSKLSDAEVTQKASELYQSFLCTLRTISARIPSQSFQSFLANETVGFTESDENNGYMNIWEMYFQGSDYDIKL